MDKQTEYVERLSAQIVELDREIEQLKDEAYGGASGSKSDNSRALADLQIKRDKAAQELQGISLTSDNEWEDIKSGSEGVMDEVRGMISDAITKVK